MRRFTCYLTTGLALFAFACSDDDNEAAKPAPTCSPTCKACQTCDTSGATPVCVDNCAAGTTCQNNQCTAPAALKCSPACGACEMCDTSGTTPVCKSMCGTGLTCTNGACVKAADPCANKCLSCQRCDTNHGTPYCVDNCRDGLMCDTTAKVCRPVGGTSFDHSNLTELQGPFTADEAGGKAVTAMCLKCHPQAGTDMLKTAHWKWTGPTPNLKGSETKTSVGKKNLVNNFCVAIASNEARCSQCHAGYGYKDKNFDFANKGAIDCLACHSTKYSKDPKTAGAPAATVDMVAAAKAVGAPTRATCGRCHFGAGGGDNVKKGDLASSLTTPAAAADVHMGSSTSAFVCADCHASGGHKLVGQGAHLPVSEGRVDCVDCHGGAPHKTAATNNHALDIACQTCHIPAFSRQLPTKMDWDWSTAGNKTIGTDGVKKTTVGGTSVDEYNYMKGNFVWKKDVQPVFAWYDGRVERLTLSDSYASGEGTKTKPIQLSKIVATKSDAAAKIMPFKLMTGRQPVDTTTRLVLSPQLFGKGGFWGSIPAASAYKAQDVEDLWTTTLTSGALVAGQLKTGEKFTGRASGTRPWDWAYTRMHLSINHEVAPKNKALNCSACHGTSTGNWSWTALGYTCDPMNDATKCGSRHK